MTDERTDPVSRLEEEVAAMRVPTPDGDTEHQMMRLGIGLPIVGIILLLVTWYQASGTEYVDEQVPMLISGGLMSLLLAMIGVGLLLRASVSRTMRFWAARNVIEQQAQTDRLIEALDRLEATLRTETGSRD